MRRASIVSLALAVSLSACYIGGTPDPGLRRTTPAPVPAAAWAEWNEVILRGHGVMLWAQHWKPRTGDVRAVVVIHHGLADHSSRYQAFAEDLVHAGYEVWAMDMRGHGRSSGERTRADRIDEYLDDLDLLMAQVRKADGDRPVFLFGHSLGGLIATLYTIERQPPLAGLILSGPALAFDAPPVQAGALRFIGAVWPAVPLLATPHEDFSSSLAVIDQMNDDKLIYAPRGPARTARSAVDGVARVWAATDRLRVPLLALHGTIDKLTAPSGSRDLVARAASTDKTLRIYPGLNHDLLHEPDGHGAMVEAEITAWLDAHTGGAPVTFTSSTPGALVGDKGASMQSVEIAAGIELPRHDALGGDPLVSASLRLRVGAGRAHGLGYHGGLDVQFDDRTTAPALELAALGLALRTDGGALVAVTAGAGIGGLRGGWAPRLPVGVELELPLGPTRLLARASIAWRLGGHAYADHALLGDENAALLGLRLGRDRRYWGSVIAGAGPFLAVTYRNLGGAEAWGLAIGGQLWGGS
ncbi:MAG: lysophospholipase [Deltaproteobacteria bacterium]|nr:lysophospholipase [Deltaproteobacteria bacterium]